MSKTDKQPSFSFSNEKFMWVVWKIKALSTIRTYHQHIAYRRQTSNNYDNL